MPGLVVERYDQRSIDDLVAYTGYSPELCIQKLDDYQFEQMAEAWRTANPDSPDEIRRFYEQTDLYVWELTKWACSPGFSRYSEMLQSLIEHYPPSLYPRVVDYGSGIGTAALHLAEAGYAVTLADVPGKTLEYAKFRLNRHGYQFETVTVTNELPQLPHVYDIFISFDVFEHIPNPDRLLMHLVKWLRPGGIAAIVATFHTYNTHPHHLQENSERIAPLWPLLTHACGLSPLEKNIYYKTNTRITYLRRFRYWVWRLTGLYVLHTRDGRFLGRFLE